MILHSNYFSEKLKMDTMYQEMGVIDYDPGDSETNPIIGKMNS